MQLIDRGISLNNHLIDKISGYLYASIDAWLIAHPLLHWLANHIFLSLILGLIFSILIVRLLLTIYYSVASAIDKMWLWVLRSPVRLVKFIFGWEMKPKTNSVSTTITNYEITHNSEQLTEIMARLENIQQQQQQIIEDISLLKRQSIDIQSQKINLRLVKPNLPPSTTEKELRE